MYTKNTEWKSPTAIPIIREATKISKHLHIILNDKPKVKLFSFCDIS